MKKRHNIKSTTPGTDQEKALLAQGFRRIAGLDEAGRGALAGPLVAAAVILPPDADFRWLSLVKDSKLLSPKTRETVFKMMNDSGIETGVGTVPADVIDVINIYNATKKAMKLAVEELRKPPDFLLIDAVFISAVRTPQKAIIKGDRLCLSIACASIVAKVTRDHIMLELDAQYPQYGFSNHKGYGTKEHLSCLQSHGACREHRTTFAPIRALSRLI